MTSPLPTLVAVFATMALGLTTLVPLVTNPTDPIYGNIVDRETTVTIHKLESGSLRGSANAATDTQAGDGIDGVPFTFYRINVDLTTSAGWESLEYQYPSKFTCNSDGDPFFQNLNGLQQDYSFEPVTVTTQNGGVAKATLKTGAYLVCEKPAKKATNKEGNVISVIKRSIPFIVTTPTPHPGGQGWLYNPHVYPKNTVIEAPVKHMEVTKPGLKVANGVSISVTTKIPRIEANERLQYFAIVDPMPKELVNPDNYAISIDGSSEPLVLGQDFTVDYSPEAPMNNAVGFALSHSGLEKLEGNANKRITASFTATMNAVPEGGQANNAAWVLASAGFGPGIDGPYLPTAFSAQDKPLPMPIDDDGVVAYNPVIWPDEPGGTPGSQDYENPPVRTKNTVGMTWSKLTIHKFDQAQPSANLAGASFEVYVARDQTQCQSTETEGEAIQIGTDKTFTTKADGTVELEGLHLHTASVDSVQPPTPGTRRCYVIKEIQAPAGYVLPSGTAAYHPVWIDTQAMDKTLDIANTQVSGLPDLPLTGASGQLILTVLGTALMAGSIGVYFVLRRRRMHTA